MPTYTNSKNGQKITSNLSFMEAREVLKAMLKGKVSENTRSFATSLLRHAKPSQDQEFWIFKMAEDFKNPPSAQRVTVKGGEGFQRVAKLFATALANGLNRRAIRLQTSDGGAVKLTPASESGKNAGFIYIKLNGEYMGKVSPEGQFSPVAACTESLRGFVAEFGNNTVQMARQFGRMTSSCCFCGRNLDTAESNAVGYGPICAEKYGLPWGYATVETVQNEEINLGKDIKQHEKFDEGLTPRIDPREVYTSGENQGKNR
jgi:uncharacterized protein DUF6011